jgi:CRISPR-associated endonuclease/helicase Cas3
MTRVRLDGVSVPTIDDGYLDLQPYDHQAAAEDLFDTRASFFAINTSPTGSGKTYSWLKPTLDHGLDTIAVYPTNALIADQLETAQELVQEQYSEERVGLVAATGQSVADWRDSAETDLNKGQALRRRVDRELNTNETTVLFTNPDLLTLVRKEMYRHRSVKKHFDRFETIVLDEFHLADVKQRSTILFLIDEIAALPSSQSRTSRFFFLSATPEGTDQYGRGLMTRLREDVEVNPVELSADARPSETVSPPGWREVMPTVDIDLRAASTFQTADELLDSETIEEFVSFCDPGETVVMLDGVHEVDRVYETLQNRCSGRVERITGFDRGDIDRKIDSFDVLVSNSAVEVGLDFQPDRLVFSAHDAPTLVQRLGRLRSKDERGDPHEAWCYVPGPVKAKIETRLKKETSEPCPRSKFERIGREAYTTGCDLSSFNRRWADLEAFHYVKQRADRATSDRRNEILNQGIERIERHFYRPYGREVEKSDLQRLHEWTGYRVLDELQPYRGSGFQVMVKDRTGDDLELKLYDVFYLLRHGQVRFVPREQFREGLSSEEYNFYRAYRAYAVGFCEFYGRVDSSTDGESEGRRVRLTDERGALHASKTDSSEARDPVVVDGLSVRIPDGSQPDGLGYLQEEMIEAERLCYVLPGAPSKNETIYDLDAFFFLYPMDDASLALGLDAFYMHCLVQDRLEAEESDWGW